MNLEFENTATVANVNVRKELHGDENVVATDVKLTMEVAKDALHCIDLDGESVSENFWDDEGFPRWPLIEKLPTNIKEENHQIHLGKIHLTPVTVKKLVIIPKANNVAQLEFTVSAEPAKGVVEKLARLLESETIDCKLEPRQEGLDLSEPQTEAA